MNQVEELVKVVAEAQTDKGNVVIVTGKPGSGKSKVLREAAESQKWTYVDCRMLISVRISWQFRLLTEACMLLICLQIFWQATMQMLSFLTDCRPCLYLYSTSIPTA